MSFIFIHNNINFINPFNKLNLGTMKKLLFIFLLALLLPVKSYSQQYATIGVYGGLMVPMGNFGDVFKTSPTIGAEGYYTLAASIDIYADVGYTFLSFKNTLPTYSDENYYYLESSAGARYTFTPSTKGKIFIEAGLGAYTFGVKYTYNGIAYNSSTTDFGINGGVGGILPISPKFEFMAKAKLHNIFTTGSSTTYFALTAGFNYNLR